MVDKIRADIYSVLNQLRDQERVACDKWADSRHEEDRMEWQLVCLEFNKTYIQIEWTKEELEEMEAKWSRYGDDYYNL
jgi:hypothetical protein